VRTGHGNKCTFNYYPQLSGKHNHLLGTACLSAALSYKMKLLKTSIVASSHNSWMQKFHA